ncbi:MAG: ABC transporter substrate-binding protein [Bacteroidota bacterium]|nr:ABC transporter substrate-binding protein [Bacteroidota bacterium]
MAAFFTLAFQSGAQELIKLRYMPHWLHQAQFAGYYMAKEKGIYESYGLDVEILMGGPNFPAVPVLTENRTDFTSMFLSGAIKARASGVDVVDIGQLSQRSALLFIAKKSSGIDEPGDFNGKKIGIWRSDFQELPRAFLQKYNIQAEIFPITSTVNLFLRGGLDIMCVMWYNEFHQVLSHGIREDELEVFAFYEHELDFPEDAIICLQSFYEDNTKACGDFITATLEGWNYAFEHKEESLELVLRYMKEANIQANRAHQSWMLNRMEDIFKADGEQMTGGLKREDYLNTAEILKTSGTIDHFPAFEDFNKTPSQK